MFYFLLLLIPHFHIVVSFFVISSACSCIVFRGKISYHHTLAPSFFPLNSFLSFTTFFIVFYYSTVFSILLPFYPFLSFLHFFMLKQINHHLHSFYLRHLTLVFFTFFLFIFPHRSFIHPIIILLSLPSSYLI
jgi:hypothetical protein